MFPEYCGSLFTSLNRFQSTIVRRKIKSTPPQLHEWFVGWHQTKTPEWRATRTNLAVREWGMGAYNGGKYIDAAKCRKGRRGAACAARA